MHLTKHTLLNFLLYFACGVIAFFLIRKTFFLLFPIFIAYLFSEGIRNSFSRIHPLAEPVKRILTVLLLLIFFALLSLITVLLAERLLHYVTGITEFLSENAEHITAFCKNRIHKLEKYLSSVSGQDLENRFTLYLPTVFQNLLNKALELLPKWIADIASFLPRFFISLIIFIISCYYFSCDWKRIRVFTRENVSEQTRAWLSLGRKHFFRSLKQFSKAYLLLFLINFALLYLGLVLLKTKNPAGSAFLIAFVDLLPVLGCGAILVPWAIGSFLIGNAGLGIGLLVLLKPFSGSM